jgi:hypothetical protein
VDQALDTEAQLLAEMDIGDEALLDHQGTVRARYVS